MNPTARLQRERDLFLRLLELGHKEELIPLLEEALTLAVDATGAQQGYIELYSDNGPRRGGEPEMSIARGCSEQDVAQIRATCSRGIVAEALATGKTIHTPSALLDERFSASASVRTHRVEAVLCTPLGGATSVGVLYLQGKPAAGPFSDADVELVEVFARHIAPVLSRLKTRRAEDATLPWRSRLSVAGIIGRSQSMAKVLQHVALMAPLDITVFITGPAGAGKTQLARAIHDNSPRRDKRFVQMSCANLVETLAESQLFGAYPGGYTGAVRTQGKVAEAEGGTLFLDEIAELTPVLQAKLLEVLMSRIYTPLGGPETKADVRIVCATNADIADLVKKKAFRQDLHDRINVARIHMPSLSERREDLLLLAEHFIEAASTTHRLPRLPLSPAARRAIETAEWPGNVRELDNILMRALIFAAGEGATQIEGKHIFPEAPSQPEALTWQDQTRQFQKELLKHTLEATGWNVQEASRRLDLGRSQVHNLIKVYGLSRSDR